MSGANSGCCSNAEKAQGQDKVKQSVVLKAWAVSRASVSEITPSGFFSNPFKAGAVPFLLCKKSPYLEIPNEEHQPFSIAHQCSQNVVQGPGAINLERECRISGPIPHLRNPILQLNKIPGKLYTHSRARSTGLINLTPWTCWGKLERVLWKPHAHAQPLGISITVLPRFPDEESEVNGRQEASPDSAQRVSTPTGTRAPSPWVVHLLMSHTIWPQQTDWPKDYQNVHLTREESKNYRKTEIMGCKVGLIVLYL